MYQYEEYIETSTFPPEQALTTVLDLTALTIEELHGVRAEVMDDGQNVPVMFLWEFIKAWIIQERYLRNQLKDDPTLTGRLVRRMLVHNRENISRHIW